MGGMGGMGAGLGGMFGGPVPRVPGSTAPAPQAGPGRSAAPVDLLQGLQDANCHLRGSKVKELDRMYNQGMGGMGGFGAGGFF